MRHLLWILSLITNTFYVETLAAYLEIQNSVVSTIRKGLIFFTGLFVFFELHFLGTGHSLIFVESARSQANLFNVLVGVNTSSPTPLMKDLSFILSIFVIFLTLYYLKLAYARKRKEVLLTLGIGITFAASMNEVLNSMEVVESIAFLFASKAVEVFRIGEFLSRQRIAAVQAMKIEIRSLSKMAAYSFIAGGLMHDIRTPISVISAHLEKLRRRFKEIKSSQDSDLNSNLTAVVDNLDLSVGKMSDQMDRIQSMLFSYLDLVRTTNNHTRVCPLGEIVEQALELSQPRVISSGVSPIIVELIPNVLVKGVPVQIEMILANLFNNAIDTIKEKPLGNVRLSFKLYSTKIALTVSNTGPIDDATLQKILKKQPVSTKGADGNGIGLRIVSELCRANNGELAIFNDDGRANIEVAFPIEGRVATTI
jgi:signal transduction histidine kinase